MDDDGDDWYQKETIKNSITSNNKLRTSMKILILTIMMKLIKCNDDDDDNNQMNIEKSNCTKLK